MQLEYELTYRASLKEPLNVGVGPYGTRLVVEVTGGTFEGARLKGKTLSGGGDWLLAGADGRPVRASRSTSPWSTATCTRSSTPCGLGADFSVGRRGAAGTRTTVHCNLARSAIVTS